MPSNVHAVTIIDELAAVDARVRDSLARGNFAVTSNLAEQFLRPLLDLAVLLLDSHQLDGDLCAACGGVSCRGYPEVARIVAAAAASRTLHGCAS